MFTYSESSSTQAHLVDYGRRLRDHVRSLSRATPVRTGLGSSPRPHAARSHARRRTQPSGRRAGSEPVGRHLGTVLGTACGHTKAPTLPKWESGRSRVHLMNGQTLTTASVSSDI